MQSIQKLQKAIYTLINSQSTGELANIEGVFNYVPQKTSFPYVHLENGKVEEISDFKNEIFNINVKMNVFDKSKSNSKVITLCDEIRSLLLTISNLTVENHSVLDIKNKSCKIAIGDEGKIWKGELMFEVVVKKDW